MHLKITLIAGGGACDMTMNSHSRSAPAPEMLDHPAGVWIVLGRLRHVGEQLGKGTIEQRWGLGQQPLHPTAQKGCT